MKSRNYRKQNGHPQSAIQEPSKTYQKKTIASTKKGRSMALEASQQQRFKHNKNYENYSLAIDKEDLPSPPTRRVSDLLPQPPIRKTETTSRFENSRVSKNMSPSLGSRKAKDKLLTLAPSSRQSSKSPSRYFIWSTQLLPFEKVLTI